MKFACALLVFAMNLGIGWAPAAALSDSYSQEHSVASDSLRIALRMAERGESCAAAFALATRQLGPSATSQREYYLDAEIFLTLTTIARLGGDMGTAAIYSEAGLLLARKLYGTDSPRLSSYLLAHALVVRLVEQVKAKEKAGGLVDEGLDHILAADDQYSRTHADLIQAKANLARARGDFPAAIGFYEEALSLRLQNASAHKLRITNNEVWLASAFLQSGDMLAAEVLFKHCREELIALGVKDHPLTPTVTSHLAMIAQSRGEMAVAIELYELSRTTLAKARQNIFAGFSQRRLRSPMLNAIMHLQLENNEWDAAWVAYSAGHQKAESQASALALARRQDPDLAAKVQEAVIQSTRLVSAIEPSLAALRDKTAGSNTFFRAVVTLRDLAQKTAKNYTAKDEVRKKYGLRQGEAFAVSRLQKELLPSQVFVGYFVAVQPSGGTDSKIQRIYYAVVVTKEQGPEWISLGADVDQTGDSSLTPWRTYSKLMDKASGWPLRLENDPKVASLLHEFYSTYFLPLTPHLVGKSEILLMAAGLPDGFPFPALVDNKGDHLIDRYSVRHILDFADIMAADSHELESKAPSLILGDPTYDLAQLDTPSADPTLSEAISTYAYTALARSVVDGVLKTGAASLSDLPRLRSSGWEARGIAGMTSPVTLLTAAQATEQNLNVILNGDGAQHFRWIHLATHALMHQRIPENSALALSPRDGQGLLHVEEMGFGWNISCELITLSGCQTGGGPASWFGMPLGFVQAMHTAGARNLLLSTSKVDDIATALLMERFYANVADRSSPRVDPCDDAPLQYSEALAEAQRWLRDLQTPDQHRPFSHPVYWANFRLYGSGASPTD